MCVCVCASERARVCVRERDARKTLPAVEGIIYSLLLTANSVYTLGVVCVVCACMCESLYVCVDRAMHRPLGDY